MRLRVQSSPHIKSNDSVRAIMMRVQLALLPALAFAVLIFGVRVLLLTLAVTAASLAAELIVKKIRKRPLSCPGATIITAMLLVMTLPPSIPFGLAIIGALFAILIAKEAFGGLGFNIFNPALAGRAFLQAAFPVQMANYSAPGSDFVNSITHASQKFIDTMSKGTPLGEDTFDMSTILSNPDFFDKVQQELPYIKNMLIGNTSGSIGETSFILLLLGGIFLIMTKTIDWRIPVGMTIPVVLISLVLSIKSPWLFSTPLFHLAGGGFAIGAFFMATDMVTSPVTKKGTWIFALLTGALIIIIRIFSSLPEGVMFSILFMNAAVPLINKYTKPKIYGAVKETENAKA